MSILIYVSMAECTEVSNFYPKPLLNCPYPSISCLLSVAYLSFFFIFSYHLCVCVSLAVSLIHNAFI